MEPSLENRLRVAQAARGWTGTRFHHQGRLKRTAQSAGGVDCLGLLIGVARELGLRQAGNRQPFDLLDDTCYGHIPDGDKLRKVLDVQLTPLGEPAWAEAGDVLLLRFDRNPQHLAIVSDYPDGGRGIIHALAQARRVVEHPLDATWMQQLVSAYRIPDACF